jgi:hypothetical protein
MITDNSGTSLPEQRLLWLQVIGRRPALSGHRKCRTKPEEIGAIWGTTVTAAQNSDREAWDLLALISKVGITLLASLRHSMKRSNKLFRWF